MRAGFSFARGSGSLRRLVVIALFASGCALLNKQSGTTETPAEGPPRLYQSDNPTYDQLFKNAHDLWEDVEGAADEEIKARATLEQALGTRAATPERIGEMTRARAKKAREENAQFRFEVGGLDAKGDTPQKVIVTFLVIDEASLPPNQREFVRAVEVSAKAEAEIIDKYGSASARAKKLQARAAELATTVKRDFTVQSRREEVQAELGSTKKSLEGIADRTQKVASSATMVLRQLVDAFDPNAAAAASAKGATPVRPPPKKASLAPAPASRPSTSTTPEPRRDESPTAPSPRPVPAAKPADDFNP